MFKGFLLLIQFMTRIYIPVKIEYSEKDLQKAFRLFPLIGFIIGVLLFFTYKLSFILFKNNYIASLMVILVELILTGALHIDGLADSADGFFSYRSKEKIIEIMKDSRIGTNGVLAIVLVFLFKFILIAEINYVYILIMPVGARLASVLTASFGVYPKESGMAKSLIEDSGISEMIWSIMISTILIYAFLGIKSFIILLFILFFSWGITVYSYRKIGGVTGDLLGAVVEITAVFILLIGVVLG